MKLVIGIVRPEKANEVLEALYRAEVRGFSMRPRAGAWRGARPRRYLSRHDACAVGMADKVRFEIAVSDEFVGPTIDALVRRRRGPARSATGRSSSCGLERVVRIRTRRDRRRGRDAGGCVMAPGVNAGDTAWMLAATALVLLMTPALGLFYAGLVRREEHAEHVHDVRRRAGGRRPSRGR